MMSDALTNVGKRVTSNIASVRNQRYTESLVFQLAQMRSHIMM